MCGEYNKRRGELGSEAIRLFGGLLFTTAYCEYAVAFFTYRSG